MDCGAHSVLTVADGTTRLELPMRGPVTRIGWASYCRNCFENALQTEIDLVKKDIRRMFDGPPKTEVVEEATPHAEGEIPF